MKPHLGAVLTSGLAALALALALLQAAVVAHGAPKAQPPTAIRQGPTNRFSAPGNRSAVPWAPFDKAQDDKPVAPESPEGRTPERRQQEEHRSPPPPSRFRGLPPRLGPQPARKAAA
jgi:hypothetical protein